MQENIAKSDVNDVATDDDDLDESEFDDYTDTSMFNAEDIVRNIELAAQRKRALQDAGLDAKRRLEIRREQERLERDLRELDSFDFDD